MVKKASQYKITERRNGRFQVTQRGGKIVHGEDKVKILQEAGKLKKLTPKKKEAPAEGEAT